MADARSADITGEVADGIALAAGAVGVTVAGVVAVTASVAVGVTCAGMGEAFCALAATSVAASGEMESATPTTGGVAVETADVSWRASTAQPISSAPAMPAITRSAPSPVRARHQ